jgi:hypothetical protein
MPIIVSTGGSTAQNIIDRALRLLGQLESGQSATTAETADCLTALNAMLDSWRNERLMCWSLQDEAIPLVSTNSTRSLGPSGDYVTTRPQDILGAYVVYSTSSIPVRVITAQEWDSIPLKTATATFPNRLYYEPQMPNGVAYLYPVPSASSTLHVRTKVPFTSFASAGGAVELPPGWLEALANNLAISVAPEYEVDPINPAVIAAAKSSKAFIKLVNARPIELNTELTLLLNQRRSNIITDQ